MTSLTDALAQLLNLCDVCTADIQSVMLTNTDFDGYGEDGCGTVFPGVGRGQHVRDDIAAAAAVMWAGDFETWGGEVTVVDMPFLGRTAVLAMVGSIEED